MKKTLLSLALMAATSGAAASENFNGRLTGMSGAGLVTAGYADGVLANPSMGAAFGEKDDVALVINAGGVGSDKDELVDAMDELVDYVDYLDSITNVQDLNQDMADTLIDRIRAVEDKGIHVNAGASVVLAIPNEVLSLAFIAKARAQLGVVTLIDQDDYALIENAVDSPFDTEDLNSSVLGKGALIREYGLALSKRFGTADGEQWLVGVTPKRVTVETIVYNATISEYDEDDFDAEDYTLENSATSFDAGITYISGNLRYGLVVKDAISHDFAAIDGDTLSIKPLTTTAIGYSKGWLKAEAALDLNAVPAFGLAGDVQILRAGLEVSPLSWLQLRLGLQQDLENTLEDTYSAGIGLSPFDTINLDVAAVTGQDNTVGGAVQLGLRF
ncbi:conjugal transfer protein TraF [Cellvibrio sp. ARAG 10.3]|uniref:conjugal transfer protein TraF n=1 Tax=Cellvibrio sp. ARAG 10.3 TaxID=3451358 RepID=UPI003F48B3B1